MTSAHSHGALRVFLEGELWGGGYSADDGGRLRSPSLTVREDLGLEDAELGYPLEAHEVAAVGQLTVSRRADMTLGRGRAVRSR